MADDGPDLDDIRVRLDDVDRAPVGVLAGRSRLIGDVIRYERAHGTAVVDRGREDTMLDAVEVTARSAGLDPRIARQVLRTVIDVFTLLEVEELGPAHG